MRQKAYAKVNIFLKIVGMRGNYHEIKSRFVLVKNLYDELRLIPKEKDDEFELYGEFGCRLEQNTIYKAFVALCEAGYKTKVKKMFEKYALDVEKNIPSFAGLGGGSSDAASFMLMVNKEANLCLDIEKLAKIGLRVGADVPFFIYGFDSANVSGIGEVVEEFKEEALHVEVFTPKIRCNTAEIYRTFRDDYAVDIGLADKMSKCKSQELLKNYKDIELNDLLKPAMKTDKDIQNYRKKDWFFSGSGSSFFRVEEMG